MKNKLLLSVVASALLTTTAFAATDSGEGNLTLAANSGPSTIEYNDKFGDTSSLSMGNLVYGANILGSGSVSDGLIRIDVTDTNLSNTGVDLDTIFAGQQIFNINTTTNLSDDNITIAVYDRTIVDSDNKTWILFAGNSDTSIINGKSYSIFDDQNLSSVITYGFNTGGDTVNLDVYSTSGSEELRDEATIKMTGGLVPQFTTSCITKFDGLINIEALQDSFTNTNHDNDSNLGAGATDGLSQWDTVVFTLTNNQSGNFLEGNSTAITMQTVNADGTINVDNNFSDTNIWNPAIVAIEADGTRPAYIVATSADLTTLATLTAPATATTAIQGIMSYTTDGNLTFVLPNDSIKAGTTTYYLGLGHTAGAAGIKPVHFVNARVALEAGLGDNNNTIYPAGDTPRGVGQDAGKWVNHAFISQIPAGESGGAAEMITKYFITNRSCSVVTPQIDVVYDGTVYHATNVAELPIDTQAVYTLKDIMLSIPELATVWNASTSTKVSVEITIPGIAEQFYIYAQVKNKSINQFKDLPVYSTSERD